MVTGARVKVNLVLQMPQSGSVLQVGADSGRASVLQGSGRLVCVLTGGAGHRSNDESRDGFLLISKTYRHVGAARPPHARSFGKEVTAVE